MVGSLDATFANIRQRATSPRHHRVSRVQLKGSSVSVKYSLPSLTKRFVGRSGGLQFLTDGTQHEALDACRSGVFAAAPEVGPGDGHVLVATSVNPAPGGPVIFISDCESSELLKQFLADLSSHLDAAGCTGQLRVAPKFEIPLVYAPAMSLVASVEMDYELAVSKQDPENGIYVSAWWVKPERTARVLTSLLEWCLDGPGEVFVRLGMSSMPVEREQLSSLVVRALGSPYSQDKVRVLVLDQNSGRMRRLMTSITGEVAVQTRAPDVAWTDQYLSLARLGEQISTDLSNAFIKVVPGNVTGRYEALQWPPIQQPVGGAMWGVAHLEGDYLLDVHGHQIVTDRHLRRLYNLDRGRWLVSEVGKDRFAITHAQLAPWLDVDLTPFSETDYPQARPFAPPAYLLDEARSDFREVLLTPGVANERSGANDQSC